MRIDWAIWLRFLAAFGDAQSHGEDIERIKIIGRECPRISADFFAQQRRELGPLLFS